MLECCRALSASGRLEEARALVHDVLRDDNLLTGPLRMRAAAVRVAAERQLGRYDEAEAVARAALDVLPRPLSAGVAELAVEYGVLHLYRGTFRQARPLIQEVVAAIKASAGRAPRPGENPAAGADAETDAGSVTEPQHPGMHDIATPEADAAASLRVLAALGDAYLSETATAIPALVESARLVDSLPDAAAARTPELLAMLACGEMFMEGYTAAVRHFQRCLAIARQGGPRQMTLNVLLGLAYIDQQTGHLRRSEQRALEAGRVARATGADEGLSMSEAMRVGAIVWSRGRAESAAIVALAEHAVRTARPDNGWWSGSAWMQLALARMVGGDAAGCVEALLDGGGGPELRSLQPAYRPMLLSLLATAALRAGDPGMARQAARDAETAAETSGLSVQRAYVLRAQAVLHAVDGAHPIAAKLFDDAASTFRRAGRPIQHAWTLAVGAASAAAAQGPETAASWLDAAGDIARVHGAVRIDEELADIRARMSAAGALPAPAPAAPLHSDVLAVLTTREQEIAALVATGRRSRAIAEELFLSHRTVDTHLARIYRKLNVSSRTELAHLLQGMEL